MKRIPSCSRLLIVSLLASLGTTTTNAEHYAIGETQAFLDVDCLSVVTDYDGATDPTKRLLLTCLTNDFQFLGVPDATTNWIAERVQNGQLKSGRTRLRFPEATVVNGFLMDGLPDVLDNSFNDDEDPEIIVGNTRRVLEANQDGFLASRRSRRLSALKRIGTYTIAIMRVEDDFYGKSTTPTAAQLIAENLHPTDVNIRTQTAACSFNQLTLNVGTGALLTDGVGTVTPVDLGTGLKVDPGNGQLDDPVEFDKFLAYVNAIIGALYVANGNSIPVDFLQLCIPPDTIANAESLGFFNEFVSVFNSPVCSYVSYNMHEFGHNLNIDHSSDTIFNPGIGEFGDQVGYMGLSYTQIHTPRMCFNPAKSHQLGWYTSKTTTCSPVDMPCNIDVGGFVKYGDGGVATVLVKINDPLSGLDYYLTYNDATGFNEGTAEGANKVIVHSMPAEGAGAQTSNLVGIVGAGQSFYEVGTFNGANYLQVDVTAILAGGIASIVISTGPGIPPGSLGDPHFRTWQNEHYEYHGQCDLVLVKDPSFAFNKGLEVQIRTKVIRYWSYIKSAAIRIGTDILEVQGDADMQGIAKYWVNLEYQPANATSIAGFPLTVHVRSERKRIVTIDLDSVYKGQRIVISTWKEFVKVDFVGANHESYGNSVGMLGDFATGKTLARDGVTVMNDFWQFGEEWQVLPTDDMLFHGVEYPQFPEKCVEPEEALGKRRRRLDESSISEEEAEAACRKNLKYADPLTLKDCVYDILATQDLDMVGAF